MSRDKVLLALPGLMLAALPTAALAAPGLGSEVYGATVEPHEIEIETRYGVLTDGPDSGEDKFIFEVGYGITGHTRLAILAEFEKEPGQARKLEAFSIEAVQNIGRIGPIDIGLYGEYEAKRGGTDEVETKLLLQYRGRLTDVRLNLIAGRELHSGAKVELGYAASADVSVAEGVRVGAAAFGGLGTFEDFAPRDEHFLGPNFKFSTSALGPKLKVETGYLFALGAAKDDTSGMIRLNMEIEL